MTTSPTDRQLQLRNLIAKHCGHPRAHALTLVGLCESAGVADAIFAAVNKPEPTSIIADLVNQAHAAAIAPAAADAAEKLAAVEEERQAFANEVEMLRTMVGQLEVANAELLDTVQTLAEAEHVAEPDGG